jgi:ABC-type lipoprotein release transport system permease subunit
MLLLRLPIVVLVMVVNLLWRRSDPQTCRLATLFVWVGAAIQAALAFVGSHGDPDLQYFIATALNLITAIGFVLIVVAVITWSTIRALEWGGQSLIAHNFQWMVAWHFLRSHREPVSTPPGYDGTRPPKTKLLLTLGAVSMLLMGLSFFVPMDMMPNTTRAMMVPLRWALGLSALLWLTWPMRPAPGFGATDWADRLVATFQTHQSTRSVTTTTFISIVGIGVGVWALTVVLSVMSGFENDLRTKILATSPHVVIQDEEPMEGIADEVNLLALARTTSNVNAAIPYVQGDVILSSHENRNVSLVLKGVALEDLENTDHHLNQDLTNGSLDGLSTKPQDDDDEAAKPTPQEDASPTSEDIEPDVLSPPSSIAGFNTASTHPPLYIGAELASSLIVSVGSEITVVSPKEGVGFLGRQPRAKTFRVAGIFHSGMYEFDLKLAYTKLSDAQRFFNMGDDINRIELRLDDVDDSSQVVATIRPALTAATLEVLDWKTLNRNLFSALELEKIVMFIVLGFIVLVASFNIIGSLVMIIMEKSKEIAILRSMGANRRRIQWIFLLLGGIVGLIGSLSGLIVGLSTCGAIGYFGIPLPRQYYIELLPIHVDPTTTVMVFIAGIGLCLLATLYPAMEAARLKLVEGLRYE